MTLKEISKYYELKKKTAKYCETLAALRAAAESINSKLDGMPPSPGHGDRTAHYGGLIAQLEIDIEKNNEELREARREAQDFINKIEDGYIKTIFNLRFIACLSWSEVAEAMGRGEGAADSLRVACYRYLEKG